MPPLQLTIMIMTHCFPVVVFVVAAAVAVVVLSCCYCNIINLSPRFITQQLFSIKSHNWWVTVLLHNRERENNNNNNNKKTQNMCVSASDQTHGESRKRNFVVFRSVCSIWEEMRSGWCSGNVCFRSPIREAEWNHKQKQKEPAL